MLTVVARPTVDPDRLEEVKSALVELVEATLKEEGCLRYEMHQDNEYPNRFVFMEIWESRRLWRHHMAGAAVRSFNATVSGGIISFELQELTKIAG